MLSYVSRLICKRFLQVQPKHCRPQSRYDRPGVEILEDRTLLSAYMFTNAVGGGQWTTPRNWDVYITGQGWVPTPNLPGSTDTATIPQGQNCTLNTTTGESVASLNVNSSCILTIASGRLISVASTFSGFSAFKILAGGELDVTSSADFNGGAIINGRIDNGGTVNFNPGNGTTLGAGTNLTGAGVFNINALVNVTGGLSQNAVMALNKTGSLTGTGSMDDSGEFDWNGGSLGLAGGEKFEANADLKLQGSDLKTLTTGTLVNQCNASEIGGTGTLTIGGGATWENLGNPTCDVTIPTISIAAGRSGSGSFINEPDGFLDIQGTTTISGNFTNMSGSTLNVPGTLTLTNPGGSAVVNLDGWVGVDGTLILEGNISSPNGFIENAGGGTLKVGGGSTKAALTVASGYSAILDGVLEVTGTGTLNGGGQIQNNDKLQLDIGSTTDIGSYLGGNSGTLDLQASSATVYSSLTVAGSAALSGTLELDFEDGYKPTSGTAFVLLKASPISAHFDATPPGMTTTYSSTTVTVTQN